MYRPWLPNLATPAARRAAPAGGRFALGDDSTLIPPRCSVAASFRLPSADLPVARAHRIGQACGLMPVAKEICRNVCGDRSTVVDLGLAWLGLGDHGGNSDNRHNRSYCGSRGRGIDWHGLRRRLPRRSGRTRVETLAIWTARLSGGAGMRGLGIMFREGSKSRPINPRRGLQHEACSPIPNALPTRCVPAYFPRRS
jgi:hypothetical protein